MKFSHEYNAAVHKNAQLKQRGVVDFSSPESCQETYGAGFVGSICDPEGMDRLVDDGLCPTFEDVAGHLQRDYRGENALLYQYVLKLDPNAYEERQETGDCVSHACRNAVDCARAVEILLKGEPEEWVARGATEAIYGCRGHGGQGMSCDQATRFVSSAGGILLRQNYSDLGIDLSTYNASIGTAWGRSGVPANVVAEAKKHQAVYSARLTTVEGAIAALHNGYGIHCCSGQGFSNTRNSSGFSDPRGSWSHDMANSGHATEGLDEEGFLIQNSWGAWNSGPTRLGQPPGSFWVTKSVMERLIGAGGTFAVGNVRGWPARSLPDLGSNFPPGWTPI